jgi:hypothetical protein
VWKCEADGRDGLWVLVVEVDDSSSEPEAAGAGEAEAGGGGGGSTEKGSCGGGLVEVLELVKVAMFSSGRGRRAGRVKDGIWSGGWVCIG